jgi:hypothetical protein
MWSLRWWHHRNRGRNRRGERDIDDSSGWIELLEWAQEIGLVILLALALLAIMFFLLLPFVIFLVEAMVFVIALMLAVVSRQIFRRPWTVEAVPDGDHGKALRWHVVGLRRAQAAIDEAAAAIARGRAPTPNDAIPA